MNRNSPGRSVLILAMWICVAGVMVQHNNALAQLGIVRNDKVPTQLGIESIRILGGFRSPVIRWNSVVKLAFVGDISTTTMRKITSIFSEISLMTGIRYSQVDQALSIPDRYLDAIGGFPLPHLHLGGASASNNCANFIVFIVSQEVIHNIALSLPLKPVYQQATGGNDNIHCFFLPPSHLISDLEIT